MSAATEAQSLAPPLADLGFVAAFGLALALAALAARDPAPRWAVPAAFAGTLALFAGLALELRADLVTATLIAAAGAIAYGGTDGARRPLAVAAFALWTPAYHFAAPAPQAGPLPAIVGLAALAAGLLALAALLDRRAGTDTAWPAERQSERTRRALYAICAVAASALVADRHLVVGSTGVAPDDAALVLLVVLGPLVALSRLRAGGRDAVITGLTLLVFALAGLAFILGKPYHADTVAAAHHAAELALSGRSPYAAFDLQDALARFGLVRELGTHLEDGSQLRTFSYPAGAFLLLAPFVAAGLADVRWVYLALLLLLALLLIARAGLPPMVVAAALAGSLVVSRQHVLAGTDPAWALLVAVAWLSVRGRWVSPVALGLAVATRQPAWLFVPFYLLAVWRGEGRGEALRRAAVVAAVALVPQLPYLASSPGAYLAGVLGPVLEPLAASGVGIVRLGEAGALPLLPRAAYGALAAAALCALLALLWVGWPRWSAGARALPLLPLFLAWRSLASYFGFVPLFALPLAQDEDRAAPAAGPERPRAGRVTRADESARSAP